MKSACGQGAGENKKQHNAMMYTANVQVSQLKMPVPARELLNIFGWIVAGWIWLGSSNNTKTEGKPCSNQRQAE